MFVQKLLSIVCIGIIILIMWLISENRKKFPLRIVLWGLGIQLFFAAVVLNLPAGVYALKVVSDAVASFLNYSLVGAQSAFGNIVNSEMSGTFGFQFALTVSATIIFFSSFVAMLYHFGIIQKVVYWMAWLMQKTLHTSGIESLSACANIFLGQTEAPLLIRHYMPKAGRSEINSIMVGGFATIAGGVMAAYIQMGMSPAILITASLLAAPGGLMLSKIVVPPTNDTLSIEEVKDLQVAKQSNFLEAITAGAGDGLKLALNVVAMYIAFVSLMSVIDASLNQIHLWLAPLGFDYFPNSLGQLFGIIFIPFSYLLSIPANEAQAFASLVGTKVGINEFIAYAQLSDMIRAGVLSERTVHLATFALCGFANFGSIAVQIGGIGAMVPEKRAEIAVLGVRAMLIGAMVNLLTTTIASLFI